MPAVLYPSIQTVKVEMKQKLDKSLMDFFNCSYLLKQIKEKMAMHEWDVLFYMQGMLWWSGNA